MNSNKILVPKWFDDDFKILQKRAGSGYAKSLMIKGLADQGWGISYVKAIKDELSLENKGLIHEVSDDYNENVKLDYVSDYRDELIMALLNGYEVMNRDDLYMIISLLDSTATEDDFSTVDSIDILVKDKSNDGMKIAAMDRGILVDLIQKKDVSEFKDLISYQYYHLEDFTFKKKTDAEIIADEHNEVRVITI